MGFSLTAAAAIIGVAIVISIELIVSTTIPTITDVHESYDEMRDRSIEKVQTDINITSLTTVANASNYDLDFTVKNTGSITLETDYFTVLIDGNKSSFTCSATYLYPEKSAYFILLNLPGSGTARLKVVTDNGISDYYEYAVS